VKKQFLILGGAIVGIVALFFLMSSGGQGSGALFEVEGGEVEVDGIESTGSEDLVSESDISDRSGTVFVDVQGEVYQPGVIEASADARIGDVIAAAGGLTEDANTRGLNQAARVYDEMVVFVPHRDEVQDAVVNPENPSPADHSPSNSGLISLSRASQAELQTLPGIGPALSSAIVEHREANGAFNSVDELTNVPGIGAGRLDSIRDLIEP